MAALQTNTAWLRMATTLATFVVVVLAITCLYVGRGVLIPIAVAIQVISIVPPYSRQYYLKAFYDAEHPRPWWHQSLLLKNVEDLPQVMSHVSPRASQNEKDRYLQTLPNSINQVAPDIWWLKAIALGKSWLIFMSSALILALFAVAAAFRLRRVNA